MNDESLHEIQVNGKQLVFLFMAATVVAVVIFLCGVMVGRGVPQRAGVTPATPEHVLADPTASVQQQPSPIAVASAGDAPVTAGETLTYPTRLGDSSPAAETLKPLVETAAYSEPAPRPAPAPKPAPASARPETVTAAAVPKPAPAVKPAPAPKPALAAKPAPAAKPAAPPAPKLAAVALKPAAPATRKPDALPAPKSAAPVAAPSLDEPSSTGFVVQVAAVRKREEAETIARRLSGKGYPVFITTSGPNFRVRVGKYGDRKEADAIAGRLEREERVARPWVTR